MAGNIIPNDQLVQIIQQYSVENELYFLGH